MPTYRTQATIWLTDNLVANAATNTWHCVADDETALALFNAQLVTFYQAIDAEFATIVRTTDGLTWKSYDLADPEPRVPVLTGSTNLNAGDAAALPTEVALCLSFQGFPVSGEPQARKRNRVYLPFFGEGTNETTGRPDTGVITAIVNAADALLTASTSAASWDWVAYSQLEATPWAISDGWVDNEWDTQRRRGRPATSRTTFTV